MLVPRRGFEPLTCPLGGDCAIQLCHRGERALIYLIFKLGSRANLYNKVIVLISIIIPTLNESKQILETLKSAKNSAKEAVEIILVDGGSNDGTLEITKPWVSQCLSASPGRANQMNIGAKAATGDILLFLHADTRLPKDFDLPLANCPENSWGRFDIRLSGEKWPLRLVELMINIRSRITGVATGDQAIFVSKSLFHAVGRFPHVPLMEDVLLSKKLKRIKKPILVKLKAMTSSRRWEENGLLRTIFLMWRLRLKLFLGWKPEALAREYK